MILVAVIFLLVAVVVLSCGMIRLSGRVKGLKSFCKSIGNKYVNWDEYRVHRSNFSDSLLKIESYVVSQDKINSDHYNWILGLERKSSRPKKEDLSNMTERCLERYFRDKIGHYQKDTQVIVLRGWKNGRYSKQKFAVRVLNKLINEYGRKGVASANGGGVSE